MLEGQWSVLELGTSMLHAVCNMKDTPLVMLKSILGVNILEGRWKFIINLNTSLLLDLINRKDGTLTMTMTIYVCDI